MPGSLNQPPNLQLGVDCVENNKQLTPQTPSFMPIIPNAKQQENTLAMFMHGLFHC